MRAPVPSFAAALALLATTLACGGGGGLDPDDPAAVALERARALTAEGRRLEAYEALAEALAAGWSDVEAIEGDPALRPLRADPSWLEGWDRLRRLYLESDRTAIAGLIEVPGPSGSGLVELCEDGRYFLWLAAAPDGSCCETVEQGIWALDGAAIRASSALRLCEREAVGGIGPVGAACGAAIGGCGPEQCRQPDAPVVEQLLSSAETASLMTGLPAVEEEGAGDYWVVRYTDSPSEVYTTATVARCGRPPG